MTTLTTTKTADGGPRLGRLLIAALTGGMLAAGATTVLLLIGKAAGVAFLAPMGPSGSPLQAIQPLNVFVLCLVPAAIAALLLALLGRFTRRPYPIFLLIASVFLLISLLPDWTVSMDSLVTRVLLSTMHLIAAALSVSALLRSRPA